MLIDDAIHYASEAHMGIYRKRQRGGVKLPYIIHPLDVLKRIWCWETINETVACAAVLHDVLEDCATCEEAHLNRKFGDKVASIVLELTHKLEIESKEAYLQSFQYKSVESLVIKIADRLCNVDDFKITDVMYAKKYYCLANCLFEFVKERREEIEKEFGENAYSRMSNELQDFKEWIIR